MEAGAERGRARGGKEPTAKLLDHIPTAIVDSLRPWSPRMQLHSLRIVGRCSKFKSAVRDFMRLAALTIPTGRLQAVLTIVKLRGS